jgi:hypothetical protein
VSGLFPLPFVPSHQGRGVYLLDSLLPCNKENSAPSGFFHSFRDLSDSPLTLSKSSSYSNSKNNLKAFKELFLYTKENLSWPNSKERF